jgi:regulator of protease activity HflC (stomatin/prohibitin superfamily)
MRMDSDRTADRRKRIRPFFAARRWVRKQRYNIMIVTLVLLIALVLFLPSVVVFIPAGHGGVLWKRFGGGTQLRPALPEGVNLIWPWNYIEIYNLRLLNDTINYESMVAHDGLAVGMELSLRYRLQPDYLGDLHKTVGPEYKERLIVPNVASIVRKIVSQNPADELYAFSRQRIQEEIYSKVVEQLTYIGVIGSQRSSTATFFGKKANGFIIIHDVLIRKVKLPDSLVQSIEQKMQQDQLAQEYQFRLQRERFEAQRKQIEASGIQALQTAVNPGLTDLYLRWRGIEATLDLAHASTPKIVLVGSGDQGLPLLFNNHTAQSSSRMSSDSVASEASTAKIQPPVRPDSTKMSAPASIVDLSLKEPSEEAREIEKWSKIQIRLNQLGIDAGAPDGMPGSQTRAAIMKWQQQRGYKSTGYLGAWEIEQLFHDTE